VIRASAEEFSLLVMKWWTDSAKVGLFVLPFTGQR
jgi:hypothetical protein